MKFLTLLLFGCALLTASCANDSTDDHPQHRHHRHGDGSGRDQSETNPSPTPALGF